MRSVLFSTLLVLAAQNIWAHAPERLVPLTEKTLTDGRDVLTSMSGQVVYVFDVDQINVSNCHDQCAVTWPPVIIPATTAVADPMGSITRPEGTLQLTFEGHPLYFFAGDKNPGDAHGDGLGKVWHVVED